MRLTEAKGLLELLAAPWAIRPSMLRQIERTAEMYLRDAKPEAALRRMASARGGFDTRDGIAVLPARGIIVKRPTILGLFFQETATEDLASDFQAALGDTSVHSLVLHVDSPGGVVDGTESLANLIYGARGRKPIIAVIDGVGASAAYWLAAAADKVYITGETTEVGSIGVVATHVDVSKADEARGVKVTEIVAGKYKRVDSSHAPLSADGRAALQNAVDTLYGVFVGAVAKFRGVSEDRIAGTEARLFFGSQAVKAGLVDGIRTLDAVAAELRTGKPSTKAAVPAGVTTAALAKAGPVEKLALMEKLAATVQPKAPVILTPRPTPQQAIKPQASEPDPNETARAAQDYVLYESEHGRTVSFAEACAIVKARSQKDDPQQIARKAQRYKDEKAALGLSVTTAEAVRAVMNSQQ